jgi:hypothetical protein
MTDIVRQIADEMLYEGYLLWPYHRPSISDQQRRIFGCVLPRQWSIAHPLERSTIGTECLVDGPGARVEVRARFLHVVQRQVVDSRGAHVAELVCRGERYRTGEEATEREVTTPGLFTIPAGYAREPLQGGALIRQWRRLDGRLDVDLAPPGSGPRRLSVSVSNLTPWHGTAQTDALESSFCRVHMSLLVVGGAFVSPLDPRAAGCHHEQLWPVLIGEAPDRSSILASGIMLEEYPKIAAERPADPPRQRALGGRGETAWPRAAASPGLH